MELLLVRESILTKAGFIVATGSVQIENKVKIEEEVWTAALSSCLCLQLCVSLSLIPSVELSLLDHTIVCPLSSPAWSQGPRPTCISMRFTHQRTLAQKTHAHTLQAAKVERCTSQHFVQVKSPCVRVCSSCEEKEGGERVRKGKWEILSKAD